MNEDRQRGIELSTTAAMAARLSGGDENAKYSLTLNRLNRQVGWEGREDGGGGMVRMERTVELRCGSWTSAASAMARRRAGEALLLLLARGGREAGRRQRSGGGGECGCST
jgi:hypothetical protein